MKTSIEEVEKLVIDFQPRTTAYERNMLIKSELEKRNYQEVLHCVLINSDGSLSEETYGDAEIEAAKRIEIHYK